MAAAFSSPTHSWFARFLLVCAALVSKRAVTGRREPGRRVAEERGQEVRTHVLRLIHRHIHTQTDKRSELHSCAARKGQGAAVFFFVTFPSLSLALVVKVALATVYSLRCNLFS